MATYERNPGLEELAVLVGEWEIHSPQFPDGVGTASFEWLEGGAFLSEQQGAPDSRATWIFGSNDPAESQTVLYYDSRGITRVYRSTLREGTWRVWREDPHFSQRFTARIGEDGDRIDGAWESAAGGADWEHDFDMTYRRVRGRPA